MKKLCPCHSQKPYDKCCRPYHEGRSAENALALMRSRYCAYALNLASYIMKTNHPDYRPQDLTLWQAEIEKFCKSVTFAGLTIHNFTESKDAAVVTFTAILFLGKQDVSFKETSHFKKIKTEWLYTSGAIEECDRD